MVNAGQGQEIKIESVVAANPPSGGWYPWYEIHADPENNANLILCGSRWDSKDNAQYGFIYSSVDGGKSWHPALDDKHSTWVSEESCAFGIHGVAYYVSDASKVDEDGNLHHDLGTTRIYVTHDSGRTWKEAITTGWTDYSSSVVDTAPGPNQNRLYVFFNNLWTYYHSLGDQKALDALPKGGNSVGLVSYKDGDANVAGPVTNPDMAALNYHGSYPAPSFLLKDGSLITLFSSHLNLDPKDREKREFLIASVRSNADRSVLDKPVNVVTDTPAHDQEQKCGFGLTSGGAYDSQRNILYFAYPHDDGKQCRLMMTTSTDGGKSWATAKPMYSPDATPDRIYGMPALAVNRDGELAIMWENPPARSGCWVVATSTDGGKSLSPSKPLNDCTSPDKDVQALSDAYLWSVMFQPAPTNTAGIAHIAIRNMKNADWRDSHAIAVTPDGIFHPAWISAGGGRGGIQTAAVKVLTADQLAAAATAGLSSWGGKVAIVYGGNQHYDPRSGTLLLSVQLRNDADTPVRGPFKLEATSIGSAYLNVEVANAANHAPESGAVWDLSTSVPGGVLAPGAISHPYTLIFQSTPKQDFKTGDILSLSTKIYAMGSVGRESERADPVVWPGKDTAE